jgi:hypothetical protein
MRFMSPQDFFGLGGIFGVFQGQGVQAAKGRTASRGRR